MLERVQNRWIIFAQQKDTYLVIHQNTYNFQPWLLKNMPSNVHFYNNGETKYFWKELLLQCDSYTSFFLGSKRQENWLLEISKLERRILSISKLFLYYPLYPYNDIQHVLVERKFIWDRKQTENQ